MKTEIFMQRVKSRIWLFVLLALVLVGGSCSEKSEPGKSIKGEQKAPAGGEKDLSENDANCLNGATETKFEIKGGYGCIAFIPYNLSIHQKGENITYTFNDKEGLIDKTKFDRFREVYSSIGLCNLHSSYGTMQSTADFRGDLTIEITNDKGSWTRKIDFTGRIEDGNFKLLIESMMNLVDKDERLPDHLLKM
jgi:hypothetical protein